MDVLQHKRRLIMHSWIYSLPISIHWEFKFLARQIIDRIYNKKKIEKSNKISIFLFTKNSLNKNLLTFYIDFIKPVDTSTFIYIIKLDVNMNYCRVCNKQIRYWISLCNECRDKRNYHAALVSTNKKRLIQTLNKRKLDKEWLDTVKIQSENILKNWEIVLSYN